MEDHYYYKYSEDKKNNLKETFGGKIMLNVRLNGIYTEENVFLKRSTQKGNILIENRLRRENKLKK